MTGEGSGLLRDIGTPRRAIERKSKPIIQTDAASIFNEGVSFPTILAHHRITLEMVQFQQ